MLDMAVRGASLVTPDGVVRADVGVQDGLITEVGGSVGAAQRDVRADGLYLLPGLIDVHVHFNEPGRTHWEGFASGSAAFAAGGGTVFFEMPLNANPPLITPEAFVATRAAAERASHTDFALWGGLTPDSLPHMEALAECGVIGFKAFMSSSGTPEFGRADDVTLYDGMVKAAALGLPVAVHAESEALTQAFSARLREAGRTGVTDYLASRPIVAELEAITKALLFAEDTGADLHVVHVSSARGVQLIREAAARGVRVTCETCPHYLYFNEDDLIREGAPLKCAPPLRSEEERQALLEALPLLDLIASDHSPAPPDLKTSTDFFDVWGGIAGVQVTLSVLLALGIVPERIAALTAAQPAARFGVARKGQLRPGYEADFTLLNLIGETTFDADTLLTRYRDGAYLNRTLPGRVQATYLRGEPILETTPENERVLSPPRGRLVLPERTHS